MDIGEQIVSMVIAGVFGGSAAGVAAMAAIKVQLSWHRSEIRRAHRRMDDHIKNHRARRFDDEVDGDNDADG